MKKYVYFFGKGRAEGRADMKGLLGGKGANLAEMTNIRLPVPAGFTMSTEVCTYYYANRRSYPRTLAAEVKAALVSVLLLGELALEIVIGIPLGFVAGYWLCALIISLMGHTEVIELPLVILPDTYLFAGAIVAAAGVLSALIVRHRIDHLDLVGVLKTRE